MRTEFFTLTFLHTLCHNNSLFLAVIVVLVLGIFVFNRNPQGTVVATMATAIVDNTQFPVNNLPNPTHAVPNNSEKLPDNATTPQYSENDSDELQRALAHNHEAHTAPFGPFAPLEARLEGVQEKLTEMQILHDDFVHHGDWEALLSLGKLYKNGDYPRFRPNEDLALQIFQMCAACPNGRVAGTAQSLFIETRLHPIATHDRGGYDFPTHHADALALAAHLIATTPPNAFERVVAQPVNMTRQERNRNNVAADHGDAPDDLAVQLQQIADNDGLGALHRPRSDTQNVHDHGVTSTVRTNIRLLREHLDRNNRYERHERRHRGNGRHAQSNESLQIDRLKQEIQRYIQQSPCGRGASGKDAIRVLHALKPTKLNSYDASELEVLQMVWKKIKQSGDSDLANVLVEQLASAVDKGSVVCPSGRISRLLAVFDGTTAVPELQTLRPMWAVREELAALAARTRGDDDNYDESVQREFLAEARRIYIDELGMDEKVLAPIFNEYASAF